MSHCATFSFQRKLFSHFHWRQVCQAGEKFLSLHESEHFLLPQFLSTSLCQWFPIRRLDLLSDLLLLQYDSY